MRESRFYSSNEARFKKTWKNRAPADKLKAGARRTNMDLAALLKQSEEQQRFLQNKKWFSLLI